MSADMTETQGNWLSVDELRQARDQVPLVYVDAIPVRVDDRGQVTEIGLLLAPSRTVCSSGCSYRVRSAAGTGP